MDAAIELLKWHSDLLELESEVTEHNTKHLLNSNWTQPMVEVEQLLACDGTHREIS